MKLVRISDIVHGLLKNNHKKTGVPMGAFVDRLVWRELHGDAGDEESGRSLESARQDAGGHRAAEEAGETARPVKSNSPHRACEPGTGGAGSDQVAAGKRPGVSRHPAGGKRHTEAELAARVKDISAEQKPVAKTEDGPVNVPSPLEDRKAPF